jgi:hypothetical protein
MIRGIKIVSIPVSNQDASLNVFATAKLLKSKGVQLAGEPKKEVWGTMAKFKDPDGNEFVFSSR